MIPFPPSDDPSDAHEGARSGAESTFAWFAARREAGGGPDFEAFVAEHPEQESELRALHANWSRADAASSPSASGSAFGGSLVPGGRIGEFRLVERLGRGGMGEVWEAVQESLKRTVALKLLLPGRLGERGIEFFEREARAGAKLSHPGIVTVYASGESEGVHWISMELVESRRTLADLLDDARARDELSAEHYGQISELVATVADALEVAHGEGVIHRDLKPANILLGADGSPKVGDFGLARVVSEHSLLMTGDIAGTYYYMSPEQVAAKRIGIDHRTDVFSLGVVLYELLTLVRPFEGDTVHQIAAKILMDEPLEPQQIRSRVPLDLAVICGKALEKKPDARYATMAELAADLRRYLAHEPILAKPPTMLQRAVKWVRRHPTQSAVGVVGSAAFVVISVLLVDNLRTSKALSISIADLEVEKTKLETALESLQVREQQLSQRTQDLATRTREAQQSAEEAERERDISVAVVNFLTGDLLGAVAPSAKAGAGKDVLMRDVLDVAAKAIEGSFEDQPEVEIKIRQTLALTYWKLGERETALPHLREVLALTSSTPGMEDSRTVDSLSMLGTSLGARGGEDVEAERLLREAVDIWRRLPGVEDRTGVNALNNLGRFLLVRKRTAEAELVFREAMKICREKLDVEDSYMRSTMKSWAMFLWYTDQPVEAEIAIRELLEIELGLLGDEDPETIDTMNTLALTLQNQGRFAEAEPYFRDVLKWSRLVQGDLHPATLTAINNLGYLLWKAERFDDAEPFLLEALEGCRKAPGMGDDHTDTIETTLNLGRLYSSKGEVDKADSYLLTALEGARSIYEERDQRTMLIAGTLAIHYTDTGRHYAAEPLAREILENTPESPFRAKMEETLKSILVELGKDE